MNFDIFFSSIEKIVSLDEHEKSFVQHHLQSRELKRGHYLVRPGEICKKTCFIQSGSTRAYFVDLNGQEHIIQFGIDGWWCSDFNSFLNQQPAELFVQALEDCMLIELTASKLEIIYDRVPKFERFFRILTGRAYGAFQTRMLHNLSMDAELRYVHFAEKYPEINKRISQKHIASYLGMSAEFLSKIKRRLVEKERFSRSLNE